MIGVSYFLTNENNQVGTYDRGLKWGGGAEKRENIMLNTIVPIHIHVFAVI